MDQEARKQALRMIENGVFVVTTKTSSGCFGSTVTWVTQTSFVPPLISVALRADSGVYAAVKEAGQFALHMLNRDQKAFAAKFFRPSSSDGKTVNGQPYQVSQLGNPILDDAAAVVECNVKTVVEEGDHHVVLGEVVDAKVKDSSTALCVRDAGWTYGG